MLYGATKEHPAQVDVVEVDEPTGEIRSYEWTGMLASAKKAALVELWEQYAKTNGVETGEPDAEGAEVQAQKSSPSDR